MDVVRSACVTCTSDVSKFKSERRKKDIQSFIDFSVCQERQRFEKQTFSSHRPLTLSCGVRGLL